MNIDKTGVLMTLAVVVSVIGVGGLTFQEVDQWHERSEEWCDNHDGDLQESFAGGKYSGLECDLPSGKTVDMGDVAERGYPDPAKVNAIEELQDEPAFPVRYLMPALAITLIVSALFVPIIWFRRGRRNNE